MFDPILSGNTARTRRPLALVLSFAGQAVVVTLAVLIPVVRPETIALVALGHIVAVPPGRSQPEPRPHRPPGSGTYTGKPRFPVFLDLLRQPAKVPAEIAFGGSEPPPVALDGQAGPGIPGASGGVPWSLGVSTAPAPPAAPSHPAAPSPVTQVRVGGKVQAAKLLHQVIPVYPALARLARVSGTVRLEAVIARSGTIQSLRVTSGHPLLVQAAVDAVRQWVYQPTLLNGEPVEVLTQIEVNFKLGE